MKHTTALLVILTLCAACSQPVPVEFALPVADGAVFQRGREIPVRGTTFPHAAVKVRWRGHTLNATADAEGRWDVLLPATQAGGPFTLEANGVRVQDILVGDVFLCSGQSNMELPVRRCLDAVADDVKGYANDRVRYFRVPMRYRFDGPATEIPGGRWETLDADSTALGWSAVSYFTARFLQERTGVPVGMVNNAVGGSPIEAWLEENVLPDDARDELHRLRQPACMDSIRRFNATVYTRWQETHDALTPNKDAVWQRINLFSRSWAVDAGGKNVYGSHFLRRPFTLGRTPEGPALLHLGALIDADSTFVNGTYVGNTTYMYPPRNYTVPEGILHEGENDIEIHLYATGGNPAGAVRDKRYSLETSAGEISLLDGWEHKRGRRMPARPAQVFLQYKPAGLWNALTAPWKDWPFAGVIWYQGESNCDNAADYGRLLETLVASWRKETADASLPFYVIELAAFEHSERTDHDWGWNRVQKEQRATAEKVDGVYLVPNADLGEWNDIHPQDKKTVGDRTATVIIDSKH
jgi:sialate O-acetylesterase